MNRTQYLRVAAWALTSLVCGLALVVWAQGVGDNQPTIGAYSLFPLFGLLAFSIMWTHYVMSAVRQLLGINKKELEVYFEATSRMVLLFILLHPGLLIWQLWSDGLGFPPESVFGLYGTSLLRGAIFLGIVSLLVFFVYELRRILQKYKWWPWIQYASDIAMIAILYHGYVLGTNIQSSWYRWVWIFYGVVFVLILIYSYSKKARSRVLA